MRWRNRHQGFRNCGGCCAMFRLNQLINIKAIFQSTEYLIDGFSLTRCMFLSGSTAPLEALCLKQHVRLILREVQAQCLAVSPLWSHISVWRDAFQPHGSWSIAQPPPNPLDWTSTRDTQGERVCEPVVNRNACCCDWLSEIHLKLWMNCVTISRSSVRLTVEDNVIHLPTSTFVWCDHTSLLVNMFLLRSVPYAPFLLYTYLRWCFP